MPRRTKRQLDPRLRGDDLSNVGNDLPTTLAGMTSFTAEVGNDFLRSPQFPAVACEWGREAGVGGREAARMAAPAGEQAKTMFFA